MLVRNVVGELQPKRTLAASRGFLAAARLSCLSGYSHLLSLWLTHILRKVALLLEVDSEFWCSLISFFLLMCRLHAGLMVEDLADRFQISASTCSRIFLAWINLLYVALGSVSIWPSRECVRKFRPAAMKDSSHLSESLWTVLKFLFRNHPHLLQTHNSFHHTKAMQHSKVCWVLPHMVQLCLFPAFIPVLLVMWN